MGVELRYRCSGLSTSASLMSFALQLALIFRSGSSPQSILARHRRHDWNTNVVCECVSDKEAEERASRVSLVGENVRRRNLKCPQRRVDGWMEIELGNFINDTGGDEDVNAQLIEITQLHGKGGLIVQGIEFRPE
ncbi:hypothetical protein KY284_010190 [Solanum tuberosum]|nr:hypothetical protein KY284_010190 [Solanum tuberosum]